MDIYDLFAKFELELLPKEWVQNVWKDDFSEVVEFPTEYEMYLENTGISELISNASIYIKEWLDIANTNSSLEFLNRPSTSSSFNKRSSMNVSQVDSKSWQNLIANNVQHKSLISVLSVFILKGKTEQEFEYKKLGLIATDLYLLLLAIPGSQVFHIFNPILYSNAIENLKICSNLTSCSVKPKPANKKRRGRQDDVDLEDEDEGNDSDEGYSPSDKPVIIKLLANVLGNLMFTLKKFQLKDQDDSLLLTIQILILITRVERSSSSVFSRSPPHNSQSYLSYKAYKTLADLCCSDHGEVQETVSFIMREMMSGFLIFEQKGTKLTPGEALVIKDHSVKFICTLFEHLGDLAFPGVYTLLQHICVKIPDKADLRARGVQVVLELLHIMPYSLYSHSVVWIMSLCHNDQVRNRITGLEIVTKLLYERDRTPSSPIRPLPTKNTVVNGVTHENDSASEEDDNGVMLTQQPDFSSKKYLLGTLFSRCQDISSTVRAKALAILANLVSSNNDQVLHEMESIFVTPYLNAESIESSNVYEKGFFDFQHFLKNLKKETNANVDPLPGGKAIVNLLELFVEDEKVFVRKSSLQVLANIFLINEKWMSNKLLQVMVDNCRDMSVSVRKLLVQCLTDLLMKYPNHPQLPKYWVLGVLPLLADQEIKSQEKVLEALQTIILNNLVAYNQMKTALHALPWTVLGLIADCNKRRLFLFACHKWTLANSLRQSLITIIKSHIETENNTAAWFLLASFSEYLDIKEPQFVLDYFNTNVLNSQQVDEYCCQLVMEVMHLSWKQLPAIIQINLCDNLLKHLSQFTVPLPMIARSLDICQLITENHADSPEQASERIKEWAGNLLTVCQCQLEKVIGAGCPETVDAEVRLSQYIFTVGDAAQICPAQLSHSVVLLMQNLLLEDDHFEKPDEEDGIQVMRWKGTVSASVQAVAVVTLGKLCLQKEQTAKILVPLFGNLLGETPHAEIKINAMIALTDMCIKYTSMVELYFPEMCICLRDKNLQVRENTLMLMIQLIQEDYLKLRCPVFFYLLTTLVDEEQMIRDMISSFIINSLLIKQKYVLSQHFVEALFHYNSYMDHETYSKGSRLMGTRERAVFSLAGPEKFEQRWQIYKFMLENMMDDQLFKITYRLCTDVLAEVADEKIELTLSGTTLLQDALYVLSSDEIRLSHLRPGSKDPEDDDESEGMCKVAEAISNMARKTLVSQVVKKNVIENIVPIFIKLKHKLKQLKSSLVRDLMACLRELMKDYKTEINEILAADKELATEILHDLKNLEEEEEAVEDEGRIVNEQEVLKKAVMEVVALSEVRKSLNMSKRDAQSPRSSKRLSTSSRASRSRERSPSSIKSISQPVSNRTSPCINGTSPGNSMSSPGANLGANRTSPNTNKSSPGTSTSSPDINKSPPGTIPGTRRPSLCSNPGTSRTSSGSYPGTSRLSPNTNPGTSRCSIGTCPGTSGLSSYTNPGTSKSSPGSNACTNRSSPGTNPGTSRSSPDNNLSTSRSSPGTNKSSPGSNKSSPGNSGVKSNLTLPTEILTNGKHSSPSSNSSKSDTSSTQSEGVKSEKSLDLLRKKRTSTSPSSSEANSKSRSKKTSRKKRKR